MNEFEKIWDMLAANGYTVRIEPSAFAVGGLFISADKNTGEKAFWICADNYCAVYHEYTYTEMHISDEVTLRHKTGGRKAWHFADDAETLLQFVERMINQ